MVLAVLAPIVASQGGNATTQTMTVAVRASDAVSRRRRCPLALSWLRVDPAVASIPLVTTVTDVVGYFSFLSIATMWFGLR